MPQIKTWRPEEGATILLGEGGVKDGLAEGTWKVWEDGEGDSTQRERGVCRQSKPKGRTALLADSS